MQYFIVKAGTSLLETRSVLFTGKMFHWDNEVASRRDALLDGSLPRRGWVRGRGTYGQHKILQMYRNISFTSSASPAPDSYMCARCGCAYYSISSFKLEDELFTSFYVWCQQDTQTYFLLWVFTGLCGMCCVNG